MHDLVPLDPNDAPLRGGENIGLDSRESHGESDDIDNGYDDNSDDNDNEDEYSGASHGRSSNFLSCTTLAAYGFGEFGLYVCGVVQGFFLLDFLLEVAGIKPFQASFIMLFVQIFDAVSDPIVGMVSDRTRGKGLLFGRRRPYLMLGAGPLAIFWWLLWQVPSDDIFDPSVRWWYYVIVAVLLSFAYTVVGVPYAALTSDLAMTYDHRTSLTSARFVGGLSAGLIASFLFAQLQQVYVEKDVRPLDVEADYRRGYSLSASVSAPIVLLGPLVCGFVLRERAFEDAMKRGIAVDQAKSLREVGRSWWSLLRNRAYIVLLLVYCCAWLVVNFIQANLVLFNKFVLKLEWHTPYFMLVIQGCSALLLIPIAGLSKRIGKKLTYVTGMSLMSVSLLAVFFVPAGYPFPIYCALVVASFGLATALLIPWSMLPDVADLDEVRTGHRREGELVSLFMILQKVGLGMALAASSFVLGLAGYEAPDRQQANNETTSDQPEAVVTALRIMVTVIPLALIFLSFILMLCYPLGKGEVSGVQATLQMRKGLSDHDPLIGAEGRLSSGKPADPTRDRRSVRKRYDGMEETIYAPT